VSLFYTLYGGAKTTASSRVTTTPPHAATTTLHPAVLRVARRACGGVRTRHFVRGRAGGDGGDPHAAVERDQQRVGVCLSEDADGRLVVGGSAGEEGED
jgi:hypothetical protein